MRAAKEEQVIDSKDEIAVPIDQYQHLVEKGLARLDEIERKAIYLRFWQPYTIAEVADGMNLSWNEADRLIDGAVGKIRAVFTENGHLKRSTGGAK